MHADDVSDDIFRFTQDSEMFFRQRQERVMANRMVDSKKLQRYSLENGRESQRLMRIRNRGGN